MMGSKGPWIAMATVTGAKGYRLILGDGYSAGTAAWQDPAYLGEVVDQAMAESALQPLVEVFGACLASTSL